MKSDILTPGERLWATVVYHDRWSVRFLGRAAHIVWGTFRNPRKMADDDPYFLKAASPWRNRLGCWLADQETQQCLRIYKRKR